MTESGAGLETNKEPPPKSRLARISVAIGCLAVLVFLAIFCEDILFNFWVWLAWSCLPVPGFVLAFIAWRRGQDWAGLGLGLNFITFIPVAVVAWFMYELRDFRLGP